MSKSKKQRLCPALGREISRSECGEARQSRLACPATCTHNPFSPENYSALLDIEDDLDRRTMKWMSRDPRESEALMQKLEIADESSSAHAVHACIVWNLFFQRDQDGLTCAQRWARAGFPGLDNDARVLIAGKMQMRVILLEVHRVLDHQRVEGVDLLEPDAVPLVIVDRSLAAWATRFATVLAWAYPLPHVWRLSGTAIGLQSLDAFEPGYVVIETVRHLGGPTEGAALRRWLAEHFVRVDESLAATSEERRRLMFAGLDAQVGQAVYIPEAPYPECRAALDAEPAVEQVELDDAERGEGFVEARHWFDDSTGTMPGRKLVGRVLLGPAVWRLEATSLSRMTALRERFEKRMGRSMRFDRERRDDLGSRVAMELPKPDSALVPPPLLQTPMQVEFMTSEVSVPPSLRTKAEIEAHFKREHLRTYPDQPLPALDHKTPRQAAADPILRKKLLPIVKSLVRENDETNLRTGRSDDINGLLRELGLAEIDFPAPPPRVCPADMQDEDEDSPDDLGGYEDPSRRSPPPMLSGQLDNKAARQRLHAALARFATADEAIEALAASGTSLIEDVGYLTERLLSKQEYSFLIPFLLESWFALVPPGTKAPELDCDSLQNDFFRELELARTWSGSASDAPAMENLVSGSRQPEVLRLVVGQLISSSTGVPKQRRPSPEGVFIMIALLKAVINRVG